MRVIYYRVVWTRRAKRFLRLVHCSPIQQVLDSFAVDSDTLLVSGDDMKVNRASRGRRTSGSR